MGKGGDLELNLVSSIDPSPLVNSDYRLESRTGSFKQFDGYMMQRLLVLGGFLVWGCHVLAATFVIGSDVQIISYFVVRLVF